jgi:hypothetical protein
MDEERDTHGGQEISTQDFDVEACRKETNWDTWHRWKIDRLPKLVLPGTGIEPPEDDLRGLKHAGAKIQDKKVQIVISCAFNNKKRVHFVEIIIV